MIRTEEEHLAHYGILRKSGRYPWGSGGTENIRNRDYLTYIGDLKKQGMSEAEIAKGGWYHNNAAQSCSIYCQCSAIAGKDHLVLNV